MSRKVAVVYALLVASCISVSAAPPVSLLKNGDFETVRTVTGPATGDIGFGVWKLGSNNQSPTDWALNSAYPGELAVVSEGAPSGKNFVRIRCVNGQGSAHLFQPCPSLQSGKWYRVSAWVRGGRVSFGFYEYFEKGPIRGPSVFTVTPDADKWRQVSGYYVPGGDGFKNASLAIQVPKGDAVEVDDVQVMELAAVDVPANSEPITLENDLVRMKLSPQATLVEFADKKTGQNYALPDNPIPLFKAGRAGGEMPARFLKSKGDVLEVLFADPEVKATIKVGLRKRYFTFEVVDAQPEDLEWLEMQFPVKRQQTLGWAFAANYGSEYATCCFALNFQTQGILRTHGEVVGVGARCAAPHGIKGAKAALVGCQFPQFNSVIQEVERDNGLPCPMLDGKWVRESEPVRRSYLFATAMTEQDTDALIKYAKVGHFQTILILKDAFLKTHGHYEINTANFPDGRASFKRCADKIHAAGLKVGVHVFGPSISPNDAYVTPIPDNRLLSVPCPPLAQAVDAKSTTITLTAQPDALPPRRTTSIAFPGNYLRVGDEIIAYNAAEVGPPFRYTGCVRGACGTKAAPHTPDDKVRGLLTMWGFFLMDPESTLLDEVTANFASLVNDCKLDFIYFDASDGSRNDYVDVQYYLDKCHISHYRKFDHDVLYQTSMGTGSNLCWHIIPRSASADGHGDIKAYLDERYDGILGMKNNFVRADVGWYGLDPGSRADRLEYICSKCLGCDGSISMQATRQILETHPFARPILEMVGEYERCRIANYFPESVKAKLREKGKEFKLMPDSKGGWKILRAAYEPERNISALDGTQNTWTLQNDLKQSCRLALDMSREVRFTAGSDYENPKAITLETFDDLTPYAMSERNDFEKFVVGGDRVLTDQGPVKKGVTQKLTTTTTDVRSGKSCAVLTATSTGPDGGWTGVGKRYQQPLDLSTQKALAFWVNGDGKMEVLKLQLWDTAGHYHDCIVRVDFKGWQLQIFSVDSKSAIDWKHVEYLLIYYNGLPEKATVTCKIDDVKALPFITTPPALSNLELTVNGKAVRLPGEIRMGQSLTTDGFGTCTLWPGGMTQGRRTTVPGTAILLKPGANEVKFSCKTPEGSSPDVSVRLVRLWPLETN